MSDQHASTPEVGAELLCLICAFRKPWGVFDSTTGAAVCVECRDAARGISAKPVSEVLRGICDRIERGEFDDKNAAEQSDVQAFRHSLSHTWIKRFEEIEKPATEERQCPFDCARCRETEQPCATCHDCGRMWSEENYSHEANSISALK